MDICSLCDRDYADHRSPQGYLTFCSTCPVCGQVFENFRRGRVQQTCSRRCGAQVRTYDRAGERNPRWDGGKTSHPLYHVYAEMIARCERPSHKRYPDYGGRGIAVDPAWRADFWTWLRDVGPRPEGVGPSGRALYSIDRIDNDGNYEPGNVRWATNSQQMLNRRRMT